MRVLFTVLAVRAHLYNLVPLASALRAAGHEVRVASQPDLAAEITGAGLTAVPVGDELNLGPALQGSGGAKFSSGQFQSLSQGMTEARPERLTWEHVLGEFTISCLQYEYLGNLSVSDDLVRFARAWKPDLVIWDGLSFTGPVAARASGAAHARMSFGLDYISRMRGVFLDLLDRQPPEHREDPVAEWLSGKLSRYDCEFSEELLVGQWTVDPVPAWMRLPLDLDYLPVRYVPYNGKSGLPDWLRRPPERPRVCLTLGTSGREVIGGDGVSAADLLRSVSDLDIEVIATLNEDQLGPLPDVPDNVRVVDFVPLDELLPTCSAIIHHGGAGTLNNAVVHGVPQLVIPSLVWDEVDMARKLEERGAGLALAVDSLSTQELKSRLSRLLREPSFRDQAEEIRREMLATPSPRDLVPELEKRTALHRIS
ncbi:activator-dependent family glycosyltransferase [Amycolatopsis alba]|uniref:Glycosyl transferase family 28 n=1 Tax=Amycolatopsis alba DSM 44262 TaxID=1125972 RepID=A0A229RFN3_AMYAL|nr:activator-dependent family glycosyltransferase [Amycolatopsis alba]OXM45204.1 glycosyl transferase family 28 [Amycolatopsis alba DSM 44262]